MKKKTAQMGKGALERMDKGRDIPCSTSSQVSGSFPPPGSFKGHCSFCQINQIYKNCSFLSFPLFGNANLLQPPLLFEWENPPAAGCGTSSWTELTGGMAPWALRKYYRKHNTFSASSLGEGLWEVKGKYCG